MTDATPQYRMLYDLMHFKISKGDHGDPEDETLDFKSIGTYRSISSAEAAMRRLRDLPGFRRWPDGFRIYPVVLDRVGWPEGFTAPDADRSYWNWPTEAIVPK